MQLFTLFSYFMDGFAYAGEALTGRYIGARRSDELRLMIHRLFRIGTVVSLMATLLYLLFPAALLSVLSDKYEVIEHARRFAFWAGVVPIASFAAFLWDGVFVGATASKAMRRAMTAAFVVFFATSWSLGRDSPLARLRPLPPHTQPDADSMVPQAFFRHESSAKVLTPELACA